MRQDFVQFGRLTRDAILTSSRKFKHASRPPQAFRTTVAPSLRAQPRVDAGCAVLRQAGRRLLRS